MSTFVDTALDALKTGHSFQKYIRKYIDQPWSNKETAEGVAISMGQFRDAAEVWIQDAVDEDEIKARRKATNNICNDVSRICRKELEYTIKCTKKKPEYLYEATVYTPAIATPPSTTAGAGTGTTVSDMIKDKHIAELERKLELKDSVIEVLRGTLDTPENLLKEGIARFGTETLGRVLVGIINEDKLDNVPF